MHAEEGPCPLIPPLPPWRLSALCWTRTTEGLAVLLPDGVPEAGRDLIASLASLTVLSARIAARAEGVTAGKYLDRLTEIWTSPPS